ncbi:MAG: SDR family NAD(P)-dependent oxidoreductase [Immundisolibacterales bacterium]|nr:SDR family NAD(P)-dependent oxidoreductase [Immundisolibacterales bacterium]
MNTELEGKVAIVTGAAGGFGRELVRGLLGAGAKVAALDIDAGRLAELAGVHADEAGTGRLLTRRMDIASYAECEAAVAHTREKLGGLHILVNNGALGMGIIRMDHMARLVEIHEITPETWDRFVAVNLSGAWYMTRAAIDGLLAQGWGRVINVTTSFFTMLRGKFHPYSPPKAGLEAMAAGHAKEFAGTGVTVNVVVPGGPADTPMVPEESGIDRAAMVPPSAMVPPVLWLCSETGGTWTGHRFIAGNWDASAEPAAAAAGCRAPIGWEELAGSPVWPGGKPPA